MFGRRGVVGSGRQLRERKVRYSTGDGRHGIVGPSEIVVDGIPNERPRSLILGSLVLEPGLHLALCHFQGECDELSISRQKVVLLLKPLFEGVDLLRSESHASSPWTAAVPLLLLLVICVLFLLLSGDDLHLPLAQEAPPGAVAVYTPCTKNGHRKGILYTAW